MSQVTHTEDVCACTGLKSRGKYESIVVIYLLKEALAFSCSLVKLRAR